MRPFHPIIVGPAGFFRLLVPFRHCLDGTRKNKKEKREEENKKDWKKREKKEDEEKRGEEIRKKDRPEERRKEKDR